LLAELDEEKTIEVSTGLFTDDEIKSGKWNSEEYLAIARNYRPDHLALLPAAVGACSAEDGCGMPRINAAEKVRTTITKILSRICGGRPKANELSKRNMRETLDRMLRENIEIGAGKFLNVEDVQDTFVVYSIFDQRTNSGDMFRRGIRVDADDRIELSDDEVSVTRRTEYLPTNNNREEANKTKDDKMESKIDQLIAADNDWTEADKGALMKMNEAAVDALIGNAAPKANCACQETPAPAAPAAPAVNAGTDASADSLTKEEVASIVAKAVADTVPALVANAVAAKSAKDESAVIVERLANNSACKIQKDVLETMSVDALKGLEQSLTPSYFDGRGGIRNNGGNAAEETAVMPALFPVASAN
jgi:hypothetical protein